MNNIDRQYLDLLEDIVHNGHEKQTRNGSVYSVLSRTIRHDMREGFPLLTTKKMYFKGIRTELEWFLNGRTDLRSLLEKGNKIWVGDAYKRYNRVWEVEKRECSTKRSEERLWDLHMLKDMTEEEFIEEIKTNDEFSEKWGDLGPIYGKQWRDFDGVDQIEKLIDTLINDPDSRRMRVSAWNVGELDDMILPPCHYGFTISTRKLSIKERANLFFKLNEVNTDEFVEDDHNHEKFDQLNIPRRGISLIWNQRSVDTPLGLPFNIASYALLLLMLADEVRMVPLELIGHLEDVHVYKNQLNGVMEQLQRKSHKLPTVHVRDGIWSRGDGDIILDDYKSEDKINFPLSN